MRQDNRLIEAVIIGFLLCASLLWAQKAWSGEIVDTGRLVEAIRKAEGGTKAVKPYGIMKDYCHKGAVSQCRKGALQTIEKWKERLVYTDAEDFIRQFAEIYAPTKGDLREAERRLNKNWPKNVLHFYNKGA
jgi:hypothetical protein